MKPVSFSINQRLIGPGHPTYLIAELSGNHNQNFDEAVKLIHAAKEAGAHAVKLQTYTADTLTIPCDNEYFQVKGGTLWDGKTLHQLYQEAYTPWEWQPKLKVLANELGMDLFSTPFDATAVDFLEAMDVPVHKVASFELVDHQLLKKIAATGKPIIMSTGMATLEEITEAVAVLKDHGTQALALLKCTSAYPAVYEEMNLMTISDLSQKFGVVSGLSDHTLGIEVPIASVALGACVIEKHFTLDRSAPGPDNAFSLEPHEFKAMAQAIGHVEKAMGVISYGLNPQEAKSRIFRRSLFVVKEIKKGEVLSEVNVRSIRPGYGLAPKHYPAVMGKRAIDDIPAGTPLDWDLID